MQHIQNGQPAQSDVLEYQYRKTFGLSAVEYANEPVDSINVGLFIHSEVGKQQKREARNGSS